MARAWLYRVSEYEWYYILQLGNKYLIYTG